jgi:pyruvate, orthophosphate dikinase
LNVSISTSSSTSSSKGLAKATQNRRLAYDSYRRLLDMFGDVVLGLDHEAFEKQLVSLKEEAGVRSDVELNADHLERLCERYHQVYKDHNMTFPTDPFDQVKACVKAVFGSWNADRAIKYREIHGITSLMGTACNLQAMVFGNLGVTSGTGVAFSRDPGTGENAIRGEYLINAQGEDVVSGT